MTSSKRAYAIPKSAAPRAPIPVAVHCSLVPPQEMLRQFSFNLCGVPGSWCTQVCLSSSPLGMGIFSEPLQCLPSYRGFSDLGCGVSPHSCSSAYSLTGVSLTLDVGYVLTAVPDFGGGVSPQSCSSDAQWPLALKTL